MDEEKEKLYTLTITFPEETLVRDTQVTHDEFLVMQGLFIVPGGSKYRFWTRTRTLTHTLKESLLEQSRWWLRGLQAKGLIHEWSIEPLKSEEAE